MHCYYKPWFRDEETEALGDEFVLGYKQVAKIQHFISDISTWGHRYWTILPAENSDRIKPEDKSQKGSTEFGWLEWCFYYFSLCNEKVFKLKIFSEHVHDLWNLETAKELIDYLVHLIFNINLMVIVRFRKAYTLM